MGEDDYVGFHHREEGCTFVDVLDLASIALFLSMMGSGCSTGDEPREMYGDTWRRHSDQFRFDRRVAWWDEKAEACTPSFHDRTPGRAYYVLAQSGARSGDWGVNTPDDINLLSPSEADGAETGLSRARGHVGKAGQTERDGYTILRRLRLTPGSAR